jgi:hypothetical protein
LTNRAHVTCPTCGYEGEITWTSAPLRIIQEQGEETADKEGSRSNVHGAVSIKVGASNQKARRWRAKLRRARTKHEFKEDRISRRTSARTKRLRQDSELSLSEKFRRAKFQTYLLGDIEPRLVPTSCSFQFSWSSTPKSLLAAANLLIKGIGAAMRRPMHVSQAQTDVFHDAAERAKGTASYVALSIKYKDTGSMNFNEALWIEQHDVADRSIIGAGSAKDHSIQSFLRNFTFAGPPSLHTKDFDPTRYLHLQAISSAALTRFETALQSGEPTTWEIRRFDYPAPLAHALTVVGHTAVTIGAVGSVAESLENILPHLTRAIAGSMPFSIFERTLAESHEKWQRDARQHTEEWRLRHESSGI